MSSQIQPTSTTVAGATSYKLSAPEGFVVRVIITEALKKLEFLQHTIPKVSGGVSVHTDELTLFIGEEIGRIIQEQKQLEDLYNDLMVRRDKLTSPEHKEECLRVQDEITDVSRRLRESNKSLCRNLKENPNVIDNMTKMQLERQRVVDRLKATEEEIASSLFYKKLVQVVESERKEIELLSEVRKREQVVSSLVKELETELATELGEQERETYLANQELRELKDELQRCKNISEIEIGFEEKRFASRESSLALTNRLAEGKLVEDLSKLHAEIESEKSVSIMAQKHFTGLLENLTREKTEWQEKLDSNVQALDEQEIQNLKQKRAACAEELAKLKDRKATEDMAADKTTLSMTLAQEAHVSRDKQSKDSIESAELLQKVIRRYLSFKASQDVGGKKKKKGDKKKKSAK